MTSEPILTHETDDVRIARVVAFAIAPFAPLASLFTGASFLVTLALSLVFTGVALAARQFDREQRADLLAVALIGHCIAFTAGFASHPWQVDTHMLFFAILAIVATMASIRALVIAVAVTAVHHLVLSLFLPALVYPSADMLEALGRTVLHAAIVIFEAAVLIWSMVRSAKAASEIQQGRAQLAESAVAATNAQVAAEQAREYAVAAAERTRAEGRKAAVAIEQISVAAKAAADHAARAQKAVANAKQDAQRSEETVERAKEAMKAIEDASSRISSIVEVIDEIARRTDLLALNAAVESARAGDAGRGFAVVANEVRKLAQQSADATLQIRTLVQASSGRVHEGATFVGDMGSALSRISTFVADLNELVGEIASGAAEQSTGLAHVNVAIARIDSIVEEDQLGTSADDAAFAPPKRPLRAAGSARHKRAA